MRRRCASVTFDVSGTAVVRAAPVLTVAGRGRINVHIVVCARIQVGHLITDFHLRNFSFDLCGVVRRFDVASASDRESKDRRKKDCELKFHDCFTGG